jgi:gamma-glutamylputrescine oxidase
MTLAGHIDSYYAATANRDIRFPALKGDAEADICIVGGGYTGLSSAIHLREQGYSVILLEAERIGWGASGRNGGHCGVGQRSDQEELESMLGMEHARQLWQLGLEAVDTVCGLVERFDISCDLKQGDLHVAAKPEHALEMQKYAEKLRKDYGYEQIRYVDKSELEQMTSSRRYHGGTVDTASRHLHPLNYALGLAAAADGLGAQLFERSRVTGYQQKQNQKQNQRVLVNTVSGRVKAKHLVLACNGYLENLAPRAARRIMPINNYVLATEPLDESLARSLIRDDTSMSDSLFVINYWKLSGDNRLLFGGGETYTRRFPADMKKFVRKYMLRTYPELEDTRIDYAWGGTLAVTMNRMPSFGHLDDNTYFAQGYSGHGVPIATLAGKLIAEAISGNPERFDLMASVPSPVFPGGTLLRWPGLVAGMAWYAFKDRF